VRLRATTIIDPSPRKLLLEINTAIKMQTTIWIDVNVQRSVIGRGVDQSDGAGLHEVIGYNNVLLVWRDLDVVRADCRLSDGRIIETLYIREIRDVEGSDVVICREGEVGESSILCDVGAGCRQFGNS
jgi:hypothetical protein